MAEVDWTPPEVAKQPSGWIPPEAQKKSPLQTELQPIGEPSVNGTEPTVPSTSPSPSASPDSITRARQSIERRRQLLEQGASDIIVKELIYQNEANQGRFKNNVSKFLNRVVDYGKENIENLYEGVEAGLRRAQSPTMLAGTIVNEWAKQSEEGKPNIAGAAAKFIDESVEKLSTDITEVSKRLKYPATPLEKFRDVTTGTGKVIMDAAITAGSVTPAGAAFAGVLDFLKHGAGLPDKVVDNAMHSVSTTLKKGLITEHPVDIEKLPAYQKDLIEIGDNLMFVLGMGMTHGTFKAFKSGKIPDELKPEIKKAAENITPNAVKAAQTHPENLDLAKKEKEILDTNDDLGKVSDEAKPIVGQKLQQLEVEKQQLEQQEVQSQISQAHEQTVNEVKSNLEQEANRPDISDATKEVLKQSAEQMASVPVMMTNKMRADLKDLGYTQEQIGKLKPEEAHKIISEKQVPESVKTEVKEESGIDKLKSTALESKTADEFIGKIQDVTLNKNDNTLLDAVYEFEKTNPEKYKNVGWFKIASDFFEQNKEKIPVEEPIKAEQPREIPEELKPLAKEAQKFESAEAFEKALKKYADSGEMYKKGATFGDARYTYTEANLLDKAGYENVRDFYNDVKKVEPQEITPPPPEIPKEEITKEQLLDEDLQAYKFPSKLTVSEKEFVRGKGTSSVAKVVFPEQAKALKESLAEAVKNPSSKSYDKFYNAFVKAYESPFRGSESVRKLWDETMRAFPEIESWRVETESLSGYFRDKARGLKDPSRPKASGFGLPDTWLEKAYNKLADFIDEGSTLAEAIGKVIKWIDENIPLSIKWDSAEFAKSISGESPKATAKERTNEVRKLQSAAKKRKHPVMDKAVKDFINIDPKLIPEKLMPKYLKALDELSGRVPSYEEMQKIYYDIEGLKVKPDTYSNIKTFEQAAEKYSEIALNEVKSIEDYRKLFKDINGFKRKVNELYERGDITEQQFNDLLEQVGKDQKAVESKYAAEITSLKTELINDLRDRAKSVGLTDMTAENKRLMDRFFDLDNNDLRNLSPEELYNLHSIFDNIVESGYVDVFRLNPLVTKAEAVTESKAVIEQIEKAKPFTQSVKDVVAKLGTLPSSFWEGSVGLGKVAYGAFHKSIISPMQRAAGDYIETLNKGQTNFVKLKNKYGIGDKQMNKIGMVAMYLREYGLRHNPEYRGKKDSKGNKLGERDWFKNILENDYERTKLGKKELKAIQEAWELFGKDKVNPEDVYNSFVNNTTEYLTVKEMNFLKEAMEWKDQNMTGKQQFANELRGKPFEELLFHIKRIRKDGKKAQGDIFEMTEKGNVRIAAGSGKEVLTEEMGVIETNFEKIFTETLEENARDYFFTPMLQKVNSVIANTKKELPENKKAYMDAASQNLQAALNNEFTPSKVNPVVRNLLKAKAAQVLIAPIRTVNEMVSSLVTYPARSKSLNTYIELFKPRKTVRQLLKDTESPLRNRQNLNKYIELEQGKIKPKGWIEKTTHYLAALPELLGLEPVWMATFKNEFKKETGKDFSENEYLSNPQYKHTFNKQIKDAASSADATYEKIAGATTAAGQRRTIKILPSKISKAMGLGEGLDAKKSSGAIMSFMTGYTSREIIQTYDAFSAFFKAVKDAEYSKADAAKTLLPALGTVMGVTAYNYGQQISFALQSLVTGSEEDKKRAEGELKKLTTAEGVFTEMATGMVSLGASKYSGMGRQLVKAVASVYYNYTDDPKEKAYVKSIVRNITFDNPFDTSKSKYLMRGQIGQQIGDAIVPISTIMDNWSRVINEAGGARYLYEKVEKGEVLTEPEKEAVILMQLSVNTYNAIAMFGGKAIPNTLVNRLARQYEKENKSPSTILPLRSLTPKKLNSIKLKPRKIQ